MDLLRELSQVVSKNKIKAISTLGHVKGPSEDRVLEFYNLILSGDLSNDKEASDFFFKKPPSHPQYRKLKAKLRDRLYNTLFFIDINNPKFSDAQKAFYTCQKNWVTVQILLGRYARQSAISLTKHTLKYTIKYEFTEITLDLYRRLRRHHALKTGDKNKYRMYAAKVAQYSKIWDAECRALRYYEEISLEVVRNIQVNKRIWIKGEKFLNELMSLPETNKSLRFHLYSSFLANEIYLSTCNYKELIKACTNSIARLGQRENVPVQFVGQFYYNIGLACVQLARYGEAALNLQKGLEIYEVGTVGWYNTKNFEFILNLYSRKYLVAHDIYKEVMSTKSLRYQPEKRIESLKTHQAYLFLLKTMGKLKLGRDNPRKFSVPKFLNEVPLYSMDKRGYNIPILIVQIIHAINKRNYEILNDRIEAIEKYASRYLRGGRNFRSNCFIKMLLEIPKRQFNIAAVRRHSDKFYLRLKQHPRQHALQGFELELIPYEDLWEYTMESLMSKSHRAREVLI